jgi:hypothetical protein
LKARYYRELDKQIHIKQQFVFKKYKATVDEGSQKHGIQPYVELNHQTLQPMDMLSSWQRRKRLPSLGSRAILTPH